MFKKKKCPNCGENLGSKFSFCPNCGKSLQNKKQNYGMLGKTDSPSEELFNQIKLPMGMNTLVNSLMKNFEKQLTEMNKEMTRVQSDKNLRTGGVKISIKTSGNKPEVKVQNLGGESLTRKETLINEVKKIPQISSEKIKKMKKLPKEEPKTNIRRFSDKVIYEIEVPGVKTLEDISINPLENSIEIKALGNKKTYEKIINLSLPISEYSLSKGKLVLELAEE